MKNWKIRLKMKLK